MFRIALHNSGIGVWRHDNSPYGLVVMSPSANLPRCVMPFWTHGHAFSLYDSDITVTRVFVTKYLHVLTSGFMWCHQLCQFCKLPISMASILRLFKKSYLSTHWTRRCYRPSVVQCHPWNHWNCSYRTGDYHTEQTSSHSFLYSGASLVHC